MDVYAKTVLGDIQTLKATGNKMKQINVLITPEGEITITPTGFKGTTCNEATRNLERALGTVTEDKETSELYERQEQRQDAKY